MDFNDHSLLLELVELESGIHYNLPPPPGCPPFLVQPRPSPVLLSAPHGARTFRNSKDELWHDEDEYTASMAIILGKYCNVSVIATCARNDEYDPNYCTGLNLPYKQEILRLIQEDGVKFVLDLHGAWLFSNHLDPDQTIDLGFRSGEDDHQRSMQERHIQMFEKYLMDIRHPALASCIQVRRNRLPGRGKGTITTFCSQQIIPGTDQHVQALQIEMKPQVRIVKRLPQATVYADYGPFQASPACVLHMLNSLSKFIDYLCSLA